MRILVITNLFPNKNEPTRGIYNKQQFLELAKSCALKVVAPIPWHHFSKVPIQEVIDGIEVYHPRYFMIPKIGRSLYGIFFYLSLRGFIKMLKKDFEFDLILSTWAYPDGFGSFLIARRFKKSIVIKAHGSDINIHTKYFLRRKMISYAFRNSAKVIAVAEALKRRMIEIGVSEDKIIVIPNGVDTNLLKPMDKEECRKALGLPIDAKIILYVGNLVPVKGLNYLIDAFRSIVNKNNSYKLVIVGDGLLKGHLSRRVKDYGLEKNVIFLGRQPHAKIPYWMNACDVFCLPSLNEGCPNVVLEAMACGKPVVASRVGGIPELISKEDYGISVDPQNSHELAQALKQALERQWDVRILRNAISEFSWQHNAETLHSEIRAVINNQQEAKNSIKILYHHRTRGKGVEGVHIRGIIDGFKELGHKVILISLPGTESENNKSSSSRSAKVWKYISARTPEIIFELFEIAYNFVSIPRLWNVVRKQKVGFIYERYALFNFSGALVSRIYNIPILLEINDISTLERVRKLRMKRLAGWLENMIFNSANALITISSHFESHLMERGFPKTKIWVIPNAVDPSIFNPANTTAQVTRAKYGFNSNIVIGFVGRFEYWHGIDLLISCIPEIRVTNKKISFLLVGGNNEKDRVSIMNYAKEKGILDSLIFSGWVSHDAIPSYIAAMDIAVIPNSNSYGSPMKLFEYMAMGKAVVAPRLGPIEDVMINDQNGVMFEPGNRNSLRDALSDLIENDDKRGRIGREASKTVMAKHTWKSNGEKIIEVYEAISKKKC